MRSWGRMHAFACGQSEGRREERLHTQQESLHLIDSCTAVSCAVRSLAAACVALPSCTEVASHTQEQEQHTGQVRTYVEVRATGTHTSKHFTRPLHLSLLTCSPKEQFVAPPCCGMRAQSSSCTTVFMFCRSAWSSLGT